MDRNNSCARQTVERNLVNDFKDLKQTVPHVTKE